MCCAAQQELAKREENNFLWQLMKWLELRIKNKMDCFLLVSKKKLYLYTSHTHVRTRKQTWSVAEAD